MFTLPSSIPKFVLRLALNLICMAVLSHTYSTSGEMLGCSVVDSSHGIPLCGNKRLQIDKQPLKSTEERGMYVLGNIFGNNSLLSFADLYTKFILPGTTFYLNLKLLSVLKASVPPCRAHYLRYRSRNCRHQQRLVATFLKCINFYYKSFINPWHLIFYGSPPFGS